MKEKLTLPQFRKRVERDNRVYYLKSSDQDGYRMRDQPYRLNMAFHRIAVSYCPDTVCLMSESGNLVFNCVQYVIAESGLVGDETYIIVCENYISGGISSYVLRAS